MKRLIMYEFNKEKKFLKIFYLIFFAVMAIVYIQGNKGKGFNHIPNVNNKNWGAGELIIAIGVVCMLVHYLNEIIKEFSYESREFIYLTSVKGRKILWFKIITLWASIYGFIIIFRFIWVAIYQKFYGGKEIGGAIGLILTGNKNIEIGSLIIIEQMMLLGIVVLFASAYFLYGKIQLKKFKKRYSFVYVIASIQIFNWIIMYSSSIYKVQVSRELEDKGITLGSSIILSLTNNKVYLDIIGLALIITIFVILYYINKKILENKLEI